MNCFMIWHPALMGNVYDDRAKLTNLHTKRDYFARSAKHVEQLYSPSKIMPQSWHAYRCELVRQW